MLNIGNSRGFVDVSFCVRVDETEPRSRWAKEVCQLFRLNDLSRICLTVLWR